MTHTLTAADSGVTSKIVTITPEMAEHLLNTNSNNRSLRSNLVDRYARDMSNGNWTLTGEAIKTSNDAQLLDGQHRLYACLLSGVSFETLLVEGVDPAAQMQMDTGATRKVGDQLSLSGYKNSTALGSAIKLYDIYMNGKSLSHYRHTTTEVIDLIKAHPDFEENLALSTQSAKYLPSNKYKVPYAAAFAIIMEHSKQPLESKINFLKTELAEGLNLQEGNPAFAMRRKMALSMTAANSRASQFARTSDIIHAWNKSVNGVKLSKIVSPEGGWTTSNRPLPL